MQKQRYKAAIIRLGRGGSETRPYSGGRPQSASLAHLTRKGNYESLYEYGYVFAGMPLT